MLTKIFDVEFCVLQLKKKRIITCVCGRNASLQLDQNHLWVIDSRNKNVASAREIKGIFFSLRCGHGSRRRWPAINDVILFCATSLDFRLTSRNGKPRHFNFYLRSTALVLLAQTFFQHQTGHGSTMQQSQVCWAHYVWTPSRNLRAACETLTDPQRAHAVAALEYARRPRFARALRVFPAMEVRDVCARVHRTAPEDGRNKGTDNEIVHVELPSTPSVTLLPAWIRDAVVGMAGAHALIANQAMVRVRVAVVRGTPCPRWHVDKVPLRGLCTLYGPATVIWDEIERAPKYLETGDALFLRGASSRISHDLSALTHRSPLVEQTNPYPRLVVQTDCWLTE